MPIRNLFIKKIIPQRFERVLREIRDNYFRKYKIEKLPKAIYSEKQDFHSISFCITCMNRLFHLRNTLEKNILDNQSYKNVEFTVVNYNSKDKLDDWMRKNMQKYIDQGLLNYYRTDEPESFHASIAKNLSHRVARGKIVCNLDGDNFTGKDFAFYINYLFNQYTDDILLQFTKKPFWGTEGRIVLTKENFLKIGGYDEALLPIGHEDHDLINRAKASGLAYHNIQIENFLKYLSNTEKEKAENCADGKTSYYQLENTNRKISNDNISKGQLKANPGGMKKFKLYKNFSEQPEIY
ncbi:glycosyltransferase family 2 protein [Marivirga sp. S37H4]|uniref:Glycosyltransferase family 2 protein n=1 Tax=Marivirga aurantiaca TaxID=2802615 RepID=A0A934X171_9BACT|nr:glycosyltransferase family A protein [Marivirga aurantiaca]MBK6266520.1 glycosyltransferase family 2 protein [Marivirga aurantiaca]